MRADVTLRTTCLYHVSENFIERQKQASLLTQIRFPLTSLPAATNDSALSDSFVSFSPEAAYMSPYRLGFYGGLLATCLRVDGHSVCVCVLWTCLRLVPDVAVEDFSEYVENTNDQGHHAEEDDPGQRSDALQHRVHPHTRHLVHPTRPGGAGTQTEALASKQTLN